MSFQDFQQFNPSGVNSWTLTASEIIDEALDVIGVGSDGEEVEPEYYARTLNTLNMVMRHMQAQGLHLNSMQNGVLFLEKDKASYTIEDSKSTNSFSRRQTTADAVAADVTLTVTTDEEIQTGDTIGIVLDNKTIWWSTVASFTASTVTIDDALPSDAASGAQVFNYRGKINPVERIMHIWRQENYENDNPINLISRQEYNYLPNKTSIAGAPNQAYYHRIDPKGELLIWPPPSDDSTYLVFFDYERKMDDMKNPTDKLDMNRIYIPAVVYTTALWMCDKLQVSNDIMQRTQLRQQEIMQQALSFDDEVTDIEVSLQRV